MMMMLVMTAMPGILFLDDDDDDDDGDDDYFDDGDDGSRADDGESDASIHGFSQNQTAASRRERKRAQHLFGFAFASFRPNVLHLLHCTFRYLSSRNF